MKERSFPGSKTNMLPFLINSLPKFRVFHEVMAGSGVFSEKLKELLPEKEIKAYDINPQKPWIIKKDYRVFFNGRTSPFNTVNLFYFDPPYLMETRRSKRPLYGENEWTRKDHVVFLKRIRTIPFAYVMVSHYPCDLYHEALSDWHYDETTVMTHAGPATEGLWMNYNIKELPLATYHYLGETALERQRIKRKISRRIKGIEDLPYHEQLYFIEELTKKFTL